MPDLRDVLFTPFFNLDVSADGTTVVDVSIDWSDTCQGEFIEDDFRHDNDTPAAGAACALIDRPEVREAILAAVRQFLPAAAPTTELTIADLYLAGTTEPFYLQPGETVLSIRDEGDGTAVVRVRTESGYEGPIDADIRPTTTDTED